MDTHCGSFHFTVYRLHPCRNGQAPFMHMVISGIVSSVGDVRSPVTASFLASFECRGKRSSQPVREVVSKFVARRPYSGFVLHPKLAFRLYPQWGRWGSRTPVSSLKQGRCLFSAIHSRLRQPTRGLSAKVRPPTNDRFRRPGQAQSFPTKNQASGRSLLLRVSARHALFHRVFRMPAPVL